MPSVGDDTQLYQYVLVGNFDALKAAVEAGAHVDGSSGQLFAPIVAAAVADHAGIVKYLLEKGADPDKPVTKEVPFPGSDIAAAMPGERALHIAARRGFVKIVRLLLKRSRADPNATDSTGRTPLTATCSTEGARVDLVRLLLEAGADPTLAQERGGIPLHAAALQGRVDLVDVLYSAAPATLNRCASNAETPLFFACAAGHESVVSKLLSLGAVQRVLLNDVDMCPLAISVIRGYLGVTRILINKGGIKAVGGGMALSQALGMAIRGRQVIFLQLLLAAGGEEKRSEWANTTHMGRHLLHYGAGYCHPAAVSVLLEAGANEAARDSEGNIPRDVIGVHLGRNDEPQMDQGKEVAVRRMLQRGPAYRARSWAWPSDEEAGAGGSGGGNTAAAATAAAVPSYPPAMKPTPVISGRIFRPKENSSNKLFPRLVGRYCAKK